MNEMLEELRAIRLAVETRLNPVARLEAELISFEELRTLLGKKQGKVEGVHRSTVTRFLARHRINPCAENLYLLQDIRRGLGISTNN